MCGLPHAPLKKKHTFVLRKEDKQGSLRSDLFISQTGQCGNLLKMLYQFLEGPSTSALCSWWKGSVQRECLQAVYKAKLS